MELTMLIDDIWANNPGIQQSSKRLLMMFGQVI